VTTLAPIHIKPLLEVYCFPRDEDRHYCNQHIYGQLLEMGLIEEPKKLPGDHCIFQISERGRVHCEALTNVPLPVKQWVTIQTRINNEISRSTHYSRG